ncbi:FAD-dependent monooxygenase [Nocardia vermiculata]|uniref:3-(3-hydroxyphenyl)propionate hydroxylase n=2 Tax=Nocardia vermiculata TaxID=257274 RepID=A0A846XW93_9NOCA|nr:FAD-dependent monooxygenase [Nocardia vermiculata]NKY50907.1 3-(3-hydroxyphenyl)propionate hydroxylase [Nocardia vermiculata]
MDRTQVLIVGAGPTGLTLACELARWGIDCRIVEQQSVPPSGSRGFALKPRTLDVLDDLGVAERVARESLDHTPIRFHLGAPLLFELRVPAAVPTPQRPHPNVLSLPQWRTEAILRDRLAELGGKVEFGSRLVAFTDTGDGVTAQLQGDGGTETIRSDYLVGADGGRSGVRRHLGLPFEGTTNDDARALLADVRVDGLSHPDAVHLWMAADGMLVIRPTPNPDTCQVVASLPADGRAPELEATSEALRQLVIQRTGRTDISLGEPSWLSVWRYNLRMVDRYRDGRVFLAGDAAHVHSPFGAYGMNTGIQDAYNLGWKLALTLRGADDALLDSYEAERLPIARTVLADSDQRFTTVATPPRLLRPVLRLFIKPVLTRAQHRDRADYPTYRAGPLSMQRGARRSIVRAGDPAPDGLLAGDVRLFDLFRGPHFTALTFTDRQHTPPAPDLVHAYAIASVAGKPHADSSVHVDTSGAIRRSYGARNGTLVVIRPDGYIGLVDHNPNPHTVKNYFDQIHIRPPVTRL